LIFAANIDTHATPIKIHEATPVHQKKVSIITVTPPLTKYALQSRRQPLPENRQFWDPMAAFRCGSAARIRGKPLSLGVGHYDLRLHIVYVGT
jgi:hypothetical protein